MTNLTIKYSFIWIGTGLVLEIGLEIYAKPLEVWNTLAGIATSTNCVE